MDKVKRLYQNEIPERLRESPYPPSTLYISGQLENKNYKRLAIVGSRKHSQYGKQVTEDIIAGLAGYPVVIISGLALGIDTLAHSNALKHGLQTIAFPGSGINLDIIHPQSNRKLAEDIVLSGGALVSEFEPNFKSTIYSFPQRNRLMAAYADAVLIVEAEEKSGTLITAKLALDYNRDVLVVPGSIYNENSRGTNGLLKMGATPVTCAKDVLEALHIEVTNSKTKNIDVSEDEQIILDALTEPLTKDELVRSVDMDTSELNTLLMTMELRDLIIEDAGYFRKL